PRLELLDHLRGDRPLLGAVVEDRRAVLRARIGPLAVERGGVVEREEHLEQLAVGDDCGIEGDLHDLRVPRRAGAHRFVARMGHVPARVARRHAPGPHSAGSPGSAGRWLWYPPGRTITFTIPASSSSSTKMNPFAVSGRWRATTSPATSTPEPCCNTGRRSLDTTPAGSASRNSCS